MKRTVLLVAMLAMMVLLAAPALAQPPEVTPPFEQGTDHANSICSFSGINDHDPEEPPGGRTQSYGELVSQDVFEPSLLKSDGPSPGTFCNGHLHPWPENPPPEG